LHRIRSADLEMCECSDRFVEHNPGMVENFLELVCSVLSLFCRQVCLTTYIHGVQRKLYGNLEDRWLTPRLVALGVDEKGMGWHAFKRFRKTWLRGKRCLEDINNFWMPHKPKTMSELYSHLDEELDFRLAETEQVGFGFELPKVIAPNAPSFSAETPQEMFEEVAE
jgi:hypothetical protein